MFKLYRIQGINIIIANITGNKTVQQNAINWSKRILGKEALAMLFLPFLLPYRN